MILTILLVSSRSAANSALFSSLTVTSWASRESFFVVISDNSLCRCKCIHALLILCTSNWDRTRFASMIHFCSYAQYVGCHLSKVSPSSNQVQEWSQYMNVFAVGDGFALLWVYTARLHIAAQGYGVYRKVVSLPPHFPSNPVKNL